MDVYVLGKKLFSNSTCVCVTEDLLYLQYNESLLLCLRFLTCKGRGYDRDFDSGFMVSRIVMVESRRRSSQSY